jgi:hypothetical protein
MALDELAEAMKWTGEPAVDPDAGLVTVTLAKAAAERTAHAHNRRTVFFNNVFKLLTFFGGNKRSVASDLLCLHRKRLVTREAQRK